MADTSLKVGITLQKDKFKKEIEQTVKDAKKELKTLNGEKILTPEGIKKEVDRRIAEYKSNLRNDMGKGLTDSELDRAFNLLKEKGTIKSFKSGITGEMIETPWELEKNLNLKYEEQQLELKRLGIIEEIYDTEKKITEEKEDQNSKEKKKNFLGKISDMLKEASENLGTNIGGFFEGISDSAIGTTLALRFSQLIDRLESKVLEFIHVIIGESQELTNKVTYINSMVYSIFYTIADKLKNVINWVLDEVVKIITYIDYIIQAWFRFSLLEKTGEQYAKSMKDAENSAKEINKQLMGFDEANVIGNISDAKNNTLTPTAWQPSQIPIPDWVQWIADHKDDIIMLAEVVGIAFGTAKVTSALSNIAMLIGGPAGTGVAGLLSMISSIAIIGGALIITGYVAAQFYQDVQNLKSEIQQINDGMQLARQAWADTIDIGQQEQINKLIYTMGVNQTNGYENLKKSRGIGTKILGLSKERLDTAKRVVQNSKKDLDILRERLEYENISNEEKEKILKAMEAQLKYNEDVTAELEKQGEDTRDLKKINDEYTVSIRKTKEELGYAVSNTDRLKQSLDNVYGDLSKINNYKIEDKTFSVNVVDNTNFEATTKHFQELLAEIVKVKLVNGELLSGVIKKIPAGLLYKLAPIKDVNEIVRIAKQFGINLATGGIVNLPGHGVPINTGEAGREGVIPLTDPHAMSQLGKEIGKWVNIAIDNRMEIDGSVLATATNNYNNKERFLMNR